MTKINLDELTEIEEIQAILILYNEAKNYIEAFDWCIKTKNCWYDQENGVYEKIGVFLFEIEPKNKTVDDLIWVIVGDLPSVYLDKGVMTGKIALQTYCELMQEWVDNVINGKPLDECYPVPVEATRKNADLLSNRISFIRTKLLK